MRRRPEVLAPAGAPDCLPAAVAGGADAVYLGLRHFNARGRAENFRRSALPDHVAYLHAHGLRCYVVLNTLLHDDELPKALAMAEQALRCGVDAAIVQDLGLWRLLGRELPELERHASTQMTVHDPEQIPVLAELGARRVILARELRLDEVAACCRRADDCGVEVEHFVHGALCYAFSGQCLISNFAGCRSANRGTCAQNCRFEYRSDGGVPGRSPREAETELSMRDFALLERVADLADAGVVSLKIEGRLKGPDYVYTVARAYRAASEAWASGRAFAGVAAADQSRALREVFSRGLTDAPLRGAYGPESRVHRYAPERDERPDARLLELDRRAGTALLQAEQAPRAGQGFRFAQGFYVDGFLVTGVRPGERPQSWSCRIRIERRGPPVPGGTPVFCNSDHRHRREAAAAMAAVPLASVRATRGLRLELQGSIGEPITLTAVCDDGRQACVTGSVPLEPARGAGLDDELLIAKLGALGDSGFSLSGIERSGLPVTAFVPAAELKRLRRRLIEALPAPSSTLELTGREWRPPAAARPRQRRTGLIAAVADRESGLAALAAGADAVWLEGVALWDATAPDLGRAPAGWWLRHPAVAATSPHLAALGWPVVAGHLGALRAARQVELPVAVDHHLNVLNGETLDALAEVGARSVGLSLEVSCREVARLAARRHDRPQSELLLTVHGRVPAMLTRQDHGLAPGEIRELQAIEREGGLPYQLERRPGGYTALWEGRRLFAPETVAATAGVVDGWILELGDLEPEGVAAVVAGYRGLLAGTETATTLGQRLRARYPGGTFPGHLHQGSRELDRVMRSAPLLTQPDRATGAR